jgi:hypothetical protein
MLASNSPASKVIQKVPNGLCIRFILAFVLLATPFRAEEPPPDLAQRVALRETEDEKARGEYTYRQTVEVQEVDTRGGAVGQYHEVRDIIFSPEKERTEKEIGKPYSTLQRLILTPEDFRDIREIQPFLFTADQRPLYETRFRGDETMDGVECWVLQVKPRQILEGQRLFDGMLWVSKKDYATVRTEGQAVPPIITSKSENLFPHFTTIRKPIDGDHWFPVHTYADDLLPFRTGPQRIRLIMRYSNYRRFGAESTIEYAK